MLFRSLLLEAFCRVVHDLPDCVLVFAGPDGGLLETLRTRAKALNDRVRFLGHVSRAEKSSLLAAASLVVVPSRSEAMSIVALEAGAAGAPVLMTTECGFDDLPSSGGGELVEATVDGLALGLQSMLGVPDSLAERGVRLRKFVLERYTWGASVVRYKSLFESILSGSRAA